MSTARFYGYLTGILIGIIGVLHLSLTISRRLA